MEAYFDAKMRLFDEVVRWRRGGVSGPTMPNPHGVIARSTGARTEALTVGETGETLRLVSRTPTQLGQTLESRPKARTHKVNLPLIGAYQAANALVAAGLVLASGTAISPRIMAHLSRLAPVRGRLERAVDHCKAGAPVYVDYAHTPDGLRAAIAALRPHTQGPAHHGFRRGRRPGHGQAPANGQGWRRRTRRPCDRHRRQSPQRRPGCIRATIMAGAAGGARDRRTVARLSLRP
jgi:UDP-N-acetylmuramoyl-L-alanyl-D-glutamate--2,6-diaminopimelate ligase